MKHFLSKLLSPICFALCLAPALLIIGCAPEGGINSPGLTGANDREYEQGFAARPASLADIISQLEAERPNTASIEANRRLASDLEPQGSAGIQLVEFLIARARAYSLLGMAAEELVDVQRATAEARRVHPQNEHLLVRALDRLAQAESVAGSTKAALDASLEAVRIVEASPIPIQRSLSLLVYRRAMSYAARLNEKELSISLLSRMDRLYKSHSNQNILGAAFENLQIKSAQAFKEEYFGSLESAESALRSALAVYERILSFPNIPPMEFTWGIGGRLSQVLMKQGRFNEAEVEARRDLLLLLRAGGRYSSWGNAGAVNLARTLLPQGRAKEAERLLLLTLETYKRIGHSDDQVAVIRARALLADALAAQDRWSEAHSQYRLINLSLRSDREGFETLYAGHPTFIAAQLVTGNAAGAIASAQAALARYGVADGPEVAEIRALLGAALFARGDSQSARQEFSAAVPQLIASESALSSLDGAENIKARRIRLALESYLDLLLQAHQRGDAVAAAEAFQVADAARSGQVRRALAAAAARSAAAGSGGPELAALARREQDAAEQASRLEALAAAELGESSATRNNARIASLRSEAAGLRQTRAQVSAEIIRRFPSYAEMAEPRPATVAQARTRLRPGEAMAAFYVGQKRTYIFGVAHGSARTSFAAAALGDSQISAAVGRLRSPLEAEVASASALPAFDVAAAHRLYRELLLPLGPEVLAATELVTVPHRALGMLPFHLLVTEPPPAVNADAGGRFSGYRRVAWLARRTAVSQVPSVSALALLRSIPAGSPDRAPFIGFGDPWFNERQMRQAMAQAGDNASGWRRSAPTASVGQGQGGGRRSAAGPMLSDLERLPDTIQELQDVASSIGADPSRDVKLGRQATEAAVRGADLRNRRVVMFATHGLVPGDLEGLTQPALALTPPSIAGGGSGDGLLTADEILSLRLDADWVVLSACNTAAADADAAEAVSGLGRAFLYAGARSLLVTNWAVDSTAARLLTSELFRSQAADRALSRAEALRRAMVTLMDHDATNPSGGQAGYTYAHPMFWAPFSLIGDGGR
jgi:hypothetical protein